MTHFVRLYDVSKLQDGVNEYNDDCKSNDAWKGESALGTVRIFKRLSLTGTKEIIEAFHFLYRAGFVVRQLASEYQYQVAEREERRSVYFYAKFSQVADPSVALANTLQPLLVAHHAGQSPAPTITTVFGCNFRGTGTFRISVFVR